MYLNEEEKKRFEERLFVSASTKYGDKYIEHLLEQYKIYITSAEKISDRRLKTNEFFLTLNTALVALLGWITGSESNETNALIFLAAVSGTSMCYLWYRIVKSYDGLNEGKFKVIHLIESRLPLALYDAEWETIGRGKDRKKYWPFTHIESKIPWIFIGLYALLLLIVLFGG